MNTEWHLRQLARRETPEFEPDKAAVMWREGNWIRPTTPAIRMSELELDDLPELIQIEAGTQIPIGAVTVTLADQFVERKDLAALALIQDNVGLRSVNFAWSAAGYPDQTLGLTPYLITQGLVRRLAPSAVEPSDSVVFNPTMGFIDIPRTRELLWNVYRWQSAADRRPRGWVDMPSASILQLYAVVYSGSSTTLRDAGFEQEAIRADSVARAIQANISR